MQNLYTNTNSALYGKGVFTTISIFNGDCFVWEKHWKRLRENAYRIGVDLSEHSEESVKFVLEKELKAAQILNGRARLTFFDDLPSSVWPKSNVGSTRFEIITGDRRDVPSYLRLTCSPFSTSSLSPLVGIKSCNYLEPILSLDEAKARGFHEAIRLNERGFVTSACMANVFWLAGGELFTPSLSTGCLAGTTREFVMENIDCREVEAGIEALADAEAIFLTSAGIGVQRVAEFEGKRLEMVDHPILHLLPY